MSNTVRTGRKYAVLTCGHKGYVDACGIAIRACWRCELDRFEERCDACVAYAAQLPTDARAAVEKLVHAARERWTSYPEAADLWQRRLMSAEAICAEA
jgi:hypothetical protein